MKKLFIIICILAMTLAMAATANADLFLAVDVPTDIVPVVSEVTVNDVITPSICIVTANYVKILDVTAFALGNYTFKARWHDGSGFWSDWSDPFVAARSGQAGSARIVEE